MTKRIIKIISVLLVVGILVVSPVLAYTFRAPFIITESNGTDYDMLAVFDVAPNLWLVDNDFMEDDALDTRIETLGELAKPHMVADDKTLTAVPVDANSQTNLFFTTGNIDLPSMDIIIGNGGGLVLADIENLELGDVFLVEISGYFDTTVLDDLIYKQDSFRIYVVSAGNIRAAILAGGDAESLVVNAPMASGEHVVKVAADKTNLEIYVDNMVTPVASAALAGNAVPNTANAWAVGQSDCIVYMDYIKVEAVP